MKKIIIEDDELVQWLLLKVVDEKGWISEDELQKEVRKELHEFLLDNYRRMQAGEDIDSLIRDFERKTSFLRSRSQNRNKAA